LVEGLFRPDDSRGFQSGRIVEAVDGARFAADDAPERRPHAHTTIFGNDMAGLAVLNEKLSAVLRRCRCGADDRQSKSTHHDSQAAHTAQSRRERSEAGNITLLHRKFHSGRCCLLSREAPVIRRHALSGTSPMMRTSDSEHWITMSLD